MSAVDVIELCPLGYLQEKTGDFALMILNQSLDVDTGLLKKLWTKASLKVTVDGGTNIIYDEMSGNRDAFIPDFVSGDFDSVRPEVLEFYKSKGTKVVSTPDQDLVDFAKAIRLISSQSDIKVDQIVVMGAFGGRMDQVFANVDVLYQAKSLTQVPVLLVSHCQMCVLLRQGTHRLQVNTGREGSWCGLIPVGRPCVRVTTTGLKWNLDNGALEFGRLISTSNTFDNSGQVTITTDQDLLWCMEVKSDKFMK